MQLLQDVRNLPKEMTISERYLSFAYILFVSSLLYFWFLTSVTTGNYVLFG